jgi:5'-nucleotidase
MRREAAPPRAWQRMLSGRRLDLIDPAPVDIEIEDIAHGLARVARWNGQTSGRYAYSVAQHSLLVLAILRQHWSSASPDQELMALLHDAPEYVIGDMISPFKSVIGDRYKQLEMRLLGAIHLRFGLPPQPAEIWRKRLKRADRVAAYHEATRLAGFDEREASRFFGRAGPADFELSLLEPVSARRAQRLFLDAFEQIERERAERR